MSKSVGEDFRQRWNTTRSMADVWGEPIDGNERRRAERAELRRQADEAAALTRHMHLPPITPSGKIAYAGRSK